MPFVKEWARSNVFPVFALQYPLDVGGCRVHNTNYFTADCLPSFTHWTLTLSGAKSTKVVDAKPSELRSFWRTKTESQLKIPFKVGPEFAGILANRLSCTGWQMILSRSPGPRLPIQTCVWQRCHCSQCSNAQRLREGLGPSDVTVLSPAGLFINRRLMHPNEMTVLLLPN